MKINYNLSNSTYTYVQLDETEISKLNFVLACNKGDFLNMGVNGNICKFWGFNVFDPKTSQLFKFIDEIIIDGFVTESVEYGGYYVKRTLKPIANTKIKNIHDKYYVGPNGGLVYKISDYKGPITIDLDIRELNDFDEWGRFYDVYIKGDVVFIKYEKTKDSKKQYDGFLGIKTKNSNYKYIKEWVKKNYSYDESRNSLHERYVYRLLNIIVDKKEKIIFVAGSSEEEVIKQIVFLDEFKDDLKKFDKDVFEEITKEKDFEKLLPQDVDVAYKLSENSAYRFLNKKTNSSLAGFGWFYQNWTRDELVGLRSFINVNNEFHVKKRLYHYLNKISKNGDLPRIEEKGSMDSVDGVFWLSKRFEDFIFHLDENKRLWEVFSKDELNHVYLKFFDIFKNMIRNSWDSEKELLKVKQGDSWMDTIDVDYPMDIQVGFLELISFIVELGKILGIKDQTDTLMEFEFLLKSKIKSVYYRNELLYDDPKINRITTNVFLAYYFYPDLFTITEWESIFDKVLIHLQTNWGTLSSLSSKDKNFKDEHTGENNLSYHNGDVWYFMNNIAAIVLNDIDEKKYRKYISKILINSTKDILTMGTIGFASEISSGSKQKAQGNLAQMWSSATYIEMVDKLFGKKEIKISF